MTPTTAEEWLEWFSAEEAREPHEWELWCGMIRSKDCCPMTITSGVHSDKFTVHALMGLEEMDVRERFRIAYAADDTPRGEPALRARLLEICRLGGE